MNRLAARMRARIDDEPGMRNFLVRILKPRCKRIEEAPEAKEASRKLDQSHFDVVLLDNIMPGKKGLDWLFEGGADTITVVEGFNAMRVFLETTLRRHGKRNDDIKFIVRGLDWSDGAPADPLMWRTGWPSFSLCAVDGRYELAGLNGGSCKPCSFAPPATVTRCFIDGRQGTMRNRMQASLHG